MKPRQAAPKTINEYIRAFPPDVRRILGKIRTTIRRAAPGAKETIRYGIPTFALNGYLVYFAGFKKHVGLYPAPRTAAPFKEELAGYKGGKGTVQFPLDEPVPYGLIRRIVKFRARQNLEKAKTKRKRSV
jgi:uncharacterized protein YdhG (YjbR/CyaY superfamily)